jgi:hypothetical protein
MLHVIMMSVAMPLLLPCDGRSSCLVIMMRVMVPLEVSDEVDQLAFNQPWLP